MADDVDEPLDTEEELAEANAPDILSVEAEELPETEYDLLIPQIPLVDDPSPPEGALEALVDDLADFAEDARDVDELAESIEVGVEPVMDWSTGEFYGTESGGIATVTGDDAIVERVMKALNTDAGEFAILSSDYGSRLREMLGSGLQGPALFSEIARALKEAATITGVREVAVDNMRFEPLFERDALLVTVTLTLDTDPEPVSLDLTL